ncbi:MAG: DUF2780 domain-containing protein [Bauldia sp.]|nr:DUF2780 domain-containing protein [Bauldia sp.]
MDEFIKLATDKLGIDSSTATGAVGALLGLIKKEGDPGAVGDLFSKLPGASALAGAPAEGGGGGLVGKIGGMLGGLVGGGGGEGIAGLAASGLSPDKVPGFVSTFIDWIKQKVGPDIVDRIVSSIPALKAIV